MSTFSVLHDKDDEECWWFSRIFQQKYKSSFSREITYLNFLAKKPNFHFLAKLLIFILSQNYYFSFWCLTLLSRSVGGAHVILLSVNSIFLPRWIWKHVLNAKLPFEVALFPLNISRKLFSCSFFLPQYIKFAQNYSAVPFSTFSIQNTVAIQRKPVHQEKK